MRNSTSFVARFLVVSLLVGCFTVVFSAPSSAQAKPTAGSTSAPAASPGTDASAKPAPPAQTTSAPVNVVTQAAVKAGVIYCASRINQVVGFLTANNKSSAYLFTPPSQPDQNIFSVSLGLEAPNATTTYASASFAPTTGGPEKAGGAVYDTVQYVAQSPADVEKSVFKTLKRKGSLAKDIVILDGGSVTVFLMPAGSGCVIIKKEVVQ